MYGSPYEQLRALSHVPYGCDRTWMLAGDFNTFAALTKTTRISSSTAGHCAQFQLWINDMGLLDMDL